MAFLELFSDTEKDMLVSLPYRAGLWVSLADQSGGEKASLKERAALEDIITRKASGMFESAFVHEVMAEAFARKDQWDLWAQNTQTVPDDSRKAVALISEKLTEKDVDAYRYNIMTIGVEIAKTFREFDAGASIIARLYGLFNLYVEAIVRIIKRDPSIQTESALNISYEEDQALSCLSDALHGTKASS